MLAASAAHATVSTCTNAIWSPEPPRFGLLAPLGLSFVCLLPVTGLAYFAILGFGHALDSARRLRERELRAAALESQLARAQLDALRMQLHPHFLFNTLHSIALLVREEDNRAAVRMIAQLGDMLRQILKTPPAHEVTLEKELALTALYLEIETVRFSDRLRVSWHVDDEVRGALVPSLILQPLIENALRHGISQRSAAGDLDISASRQDGSLRLVVADDGPGLPAGFDLARTGGIGLANVRARLGQLYGGGARVSVTGGAASHGGGVRVELVMPLRLASAVGEAGEARADHV
jgi:two-component system, LytTR family, sensor kinase